MLRGMVHNAEDKQQPPYTFTKRGIYYFNRLVPCDIRHHDKQSRIVQSLINAQERTQQSVQKCNINILLILHNIKFIFFYEHS